MTEFYSETCKMTEFARTVNLNWLSLTEIKVYSSLDLKTFGTKSNVNITFGTGPSTPVINFEIILLFVPLVLCPAIRLFNLIERQT